MKTNPTMNADIRNQTLRNLNIFKNCNEAELTERIKKLGEEWDTERVLGVNSALLLFISTYLGVRTGRIWFLVTGALGAFLLTHALFGWCPFLPLIRKWGVRTEQEIMAEKIALKAMRGDFMENASGTADYLNMAEKQ